MAKRRMSLFDSLPWPLWAGIFLVAVVALGLLGSRYFSPLIVAEEWADDLVTTYFRQYAPQRDDIVLLTLRESTLARFRFRSPIDRAFLADLLDTLNERGVRAVGMDILFDQPTEPASDEAFQAAARRFRAPLVVGWTDRLTSLNEAQYEFQQQYLAGIRAGFVTVNRDQSGTQRDAFPGRQEESGWRNSLAIEIAAALGVVASHESFRIDYILGPNEPEDKKDKPFRDWPAENAKRLPPQWLQNKIVLIGADLPLQDRFRTPLASWLGLERGTLPGVVVHGHVLAQLLDGRTKSDADWTLEIAVLLVLAAAAIAIALWVDGTVFQLATATVIVAALWAGIATLYLQADIYLPPVSPTVAFAFAVFSAVAFVGHQRRLQGQFIREAFSHYLPPEVVEELVANPDLLELGGKKREISALFTDIEGFTTFAEKQEPNVLIGILNRYLDALSAEVLRHGGMIDKFIGDAVMALFGATREQPDHAARAVACALSMRDVSRQFQRQLASEGLQFGRTRIGVHSGLAVVGNVGGEEHFSYTAIGDVVNTASRLEGANKYFGSDICVGGPTRERVPERAFRPIGSLVVKGRTEGLPVFSPVGADGAEEAQSYIFAYELIDRDGEAAFGAFDAHLARFPGDRLAQFHRDRLAGGTASTLIVLEGK
jgi:adenylate cyclase